MTATRVAFGSMSRGVDGVGHILFMDNLFSSCTQEVSNAAVLLDRTAKECHKDLTRRQ